ncbi:hypothetical protein VC83_07827 [Pseudogymnoascus destructans]|uniref:Uncharacterized protein n=1 Tax=Pseudogymnoascus destructans TaxID=655981 RepID=A0A177A0P3_9PEZI|nr:uncharacterized protein VC83_07827 [Pseudogymnoascus destructans]OAF55746.1 hypothetical protein VC83_07827 [Pseudogymnoascus destructans]
MACTKETVKSHGLNIWSTGALSGSTTEMDIIGVQGLGSHPFFTWVNFPLQSPESKSSRKLVDKLWTRKDKKAPKQNGQNEPVEFMPLFTNVIDISDTEAEAGDLFDGTPYSCQNLWKSKRTNGTPTVSTKQVYCLFRFLSSCEAI